MQLKNLIINLLKVAFAVALVSWLVATGKLDFRKLVIFVEHPQVLLAVIFLWFFVLVGMGGLRWYLLMRALGLQITLRRTYLFQMIGFFFTTAMPGAIGGDLVKVVYAVREQKRSLRTGAFFTIVVDRIVGLGGLFVLAAVFMLPRLEHVWEREQLRGIVLTILVGLVVFTGVISLLFFPLPKVRGYIERIYRIRLPGVGLLRKLDDALSAYRGKSKALWGSLALTVVIHTLMMSFYIYVTKIMTQQIVPYAQYSTIYSMGSIVSAVPISPGGLGVGHVAFERLYSLAGLAGGADVFNVVILGIMAMHLLGGIPYMLVKAKLPDLAEVRGARVD